MAGSGETSSEQSAIWQMLELLNSRGGRIFIDCGFTGNVQTIRLAVVTAAEWHKPTVTVRGNVPPF